MHLRISRTLNVVLRGVADKENFIDFNALCSALPFQHLIRLLKAILKEMAYRLIHAADLARHNEIDVGTESQLFNLLVLYIGRHIGADPDQETAHLQIPQNFRRALGRLSSRNECLPVALRKRGRMRKQREPVLLKPELRAQYTVMGGRKRSYLLRLHLDESAHFADGLIGRKVKLLFRVCRPSLHPFGMRSLKIKERVVQVKNNCFNHASSHASRRRMRQICSTSASSKSA